MPACLKPVLLAAVAVLPLQMAAATVPAYAQKMELEAVGAKASQQFENKVQRAMTDEDRALAQSQMTSQAKKLAGSSGAQRKVQPRHDPRIRPIEMSLSTAILFALNSNPDVEIAKTRAEQAEHFLEEGKAPLLPQVTFKADGGAQYDKPSASTDGWKSDTVETYDLNVTVEQLIYDGNRTTSEIKRRNELVNVGNMKTEIKAQEVISDTIKHYLDVLRYQKAVSDMRLFLTKVQGIVDIVEDMYEAGGTSKTTLDYAQSRLSFAEAEMNNTISSLNSSISKLEFLTGKMPPFLAEAPDELNPDQYRMDFYLELAKAGNAKVLENAYAKEAAHLKVKNEMGKYHPQVKFQLETATAYNDGGDTGPDRGWGAVLRLEYQIFDGFARRAAKNKANSFVRELEIKDRKIIKELQRDLELAYNQVVSLEETIRATEAEIQSNIALQELNRENFKLGEINIIELIEGEERLNSSRIKRHRLRSDLMRSTYNLLILAGELTDQYFCESCEVNKDGEREVGRLTMFE